MVKQYNRTAEGYINLNGVNVQDNLNKTFTIPVSLKFVPKKIFIKAGFNSYSDRAFFLINGINQTCKLFDNRTKEWAKIVITKVSSNGIEYKFTESANNGVYIYLADFFAVG